MINWNAFEGLVINLDRHKKYIGIIFFGQSEHLIMPNNDLSYLENKTGFSENTIYNNGTSVRSKWIWSTT